MNNSIFKPYLLNAATYKGGKTKSEIKPGADLIKLSSNENLLGSSPKAIEAIKASLSSLNEYPEGNAARLVSAIAEYSHGQLTEEQIVCANSGSECIEMVIRAFMDDGLECIVSTPTFMPYLIFSKKMGVDVVDVPLLPDSYDIDIDGIIAAITDHTRIIFVTNPNNPTGTYIPDSQIKELLDRVPDHVVVVIDEVYYQFVSKSDYSTAHKWVNAGYNVIGINSLSKAYGLAGLRIGYLYSTPKLTEYINKLSRPFYLSSLAINAGIAAISDTEFIDQTVKSVASGREYLKKEFDRLGLHQTQSETNFILVKPEMEPIDFESRLLEHDIMVRPVGNFGAIGCVRITVGKEEHNIALIKALEQILYS